MTRRSDGPASGLLGRLAGLHRPTMGPGSLSEETYCALRALTPFIGVLLLAIFLIPPAKAFFFEGEEGGADGFALAADMIDDGYPSLILFFTLRLFQPIFERFAAREPFDGVVARGFRRLALFLAPMGVGGFVFTIALLAVSKWRGWDETPIHDVDLSTPALTAIAMGSFCAVLSGVFFEAAKMKDEQDHTV